MQGNEGNTGSTLARPLPPTLASPPPTLKSNPGSTTDLEKGFNRIN